MRPLHQPSSPTLRFAAVSLLAFGISTLAFTARGQATNSPSPTPAPTPAPFADGLTADAIMQKAKATYASLQSYSDTGTASADMNSNTITNHFTIRMQRPGFYRIDWQGTALGGGVVWSDGVDNYLEFAGQAQQKESTRELALASATGISTGAAATLPAVFFGERWGDKLSGSHQRKNDEKLGEIDCYVLTKSIDRNGLSLGMTLWIGKQDNLIHQSVTTTSGKLQMPAPDDATLKKVLEGQNKPVTPESMEALRKQLSQAQSLAGSIKSSNTTFTEIHSDIVTNKSFTPADFKPEKK